MTACLACTRAQEMGLNPALCSEHLTAHREALLTALVEDILTEARLLDAARHLQEPDPDPVFRNRVRELLAAYKAAT